LRFRGSEKPEGMRLLRVPSGCLDVFVQYLTFRYFTPWVGMK